MSTLSVLGKRKADEAVEQALKREGSTDKMAIKVLADKEEWGRGNINGKKKAQNGRDTDKEEQQREKVNGKKKAWNENEADEKEWQREKVNGKKNAQDQKDHCHSKSVDHGCL